MVKWSDNEVDELIDMMKKKCHRFCGRYKSVHELDNITTNVATYLDELTSGIVLSSNSLL